MADEKKLKSKLNSIKIDFVFVIILNVAFVLGFIYLIVRSQAYKFEVFWLAAVIELGLLYLFIKLPKRGVYRIVGLVIFFSALIGPLAASRYIQNLKPVQVSLFVFILALLIVGSRNLIRQRSENIRKLEEDITRVKSGFPSADEEPLPISADQIENLKKSYKARYEHVYLVKSTMSEIMDRIQDYFKRAGYNQKESHSTLVYQRGKGPETYSPEDWMSLATVRMEENNGNTKVYFELSVDLSGQIVMPWEKAFWQAEVRDFEQALNSRNAIREAKRKANLAIGLNLTLVFIYIGLLVVLIVGIILFVMFIVEPRYPHWWGIIGLCAIAGLVTGVILLVKRKGKIIW